MLKRSYGPTRRTQKPCCPFCLLFLFLGIQPVIPTGLFFMMLSCFSCFFSLYVSHPDAALHLHLGHNLVGALDDLQKDLEERLDIQVFQYEALYALVARVQI
jgi:hypothetical protein